MREFFISLDTRDGMMTLDNYEDVIIKIVRDMNSKREKGRLPVYMMSVRDDIFLRSELIEKIIDLLDRASINELDIHVVSDDDYLVVSEDAVNFATYIINKYSKNDHINVIIDVKIDSETIYTDEKIKVLYLLHATGEKYLRIWLNVTGENIKHFPAVITRIAEVKLLDHTSVTFDVDIYGSLTSETQNALKSLPLHVLDFLMDKYITEMTVWQNSEPTCYDHEGNVIWKCPLYRECVLVSRRRSKVRMANLLIAIVRDLPSSEDIRSKITDSDVKQDMELDMMDSCEGCDHHGR